MTAHEFLSIRAGGGTQSRGVVSLRCPNCQQVGTFASYGNTADINSGGHWVGMRACPNLACGAIVYVVVTGTNVVASYPPQLIDFDATNLPEPVIKSFEEAILCHANACYRASALMVRRTLEDLCDDQGAAGSNLRDRLKVLAGRVAVPEDLIDALDDVRLLGNDAAHVELKDFDEVGKDEVEIALEITKEVLKNAYQLAALRERLSARKRAT